MQPNRIFFTVTHFKDYAIAIPETESIYCVVFADMWAAGLLKAGWWSQGSKPQHTDMCRGHHGSVTVPDAWLICLWETPVLQHCANIHCIAHSLFYIIKKYLLGLNWIFFWLCCFRCKLFKIWKYFDSGNVLDSESVRFWICLGNGLPVLN